MTENPVLDAATYSGGTYSATAEKGKCDLVISGATSLSESSAWTDSDKFTVTTILDLQTTSDDATSGL